MKYGHGAGSARCFGPPCRSIAEIKTKLTLWPSIEAAENMPNGQAPSPSPATCHRTMSGQTVKSSNTTDAEGRLVLCDALKPYVKRFDPAALLNLATLTGAASVAPGPPRPTGLLATNDELWPTNLLAPANRANDKSWRLRRFFGEYQSLLDSTLRIWQTSRRAVNHHRGLLPGPYGQSYRWAHLDNRRTAWHSAKPKALQAARGPCWSIPDVPMPATKRLLCILRKPQLCCRAPTPEAGQEE